MTVRHHDPAAEANAKLGGSLTALVLEPSPPADHNEPFFADDPTAVPPGATQTVGPTSAAHRTWGDLVAERPELSSWAAERWLAAYRPLEPVPAGRQWLQGSHGYWSGRGPRCAGRNRGRGRQG